MEDKIIYFEKSGKLNTEETLNLAVERAIARGIQKIIIASTTGNTARLLADKLIGTNITMVVIPHQYTQERPQRFQLELIPILEKQGHSVHFSTMLFHTWDLYGVAIPRVMAVLLRTFCQGMKVCVEITLMAVDGGCIASGEKVVAIAGDGGGADTAVTALAASSRDLPNLHIIEIICKPVQTKQRVPNFVPPEG